jgi:gamma-glutamylcyclotransferase (GGCT)/AIG2-like uncharacterized protein YtfP
MFYVITKNMFSEHIFVYGTLLISSNQFAGYLQQQCTLVDRGKFKGKLYDIGEYPGVVINNNGDQYVYGSIYLMHNPEQVLAVIDEYEGISIHDPHPQEYARNLIDIEGENGIVTCWVYIYNWPIVGKDQIWSGNYLQYAKWE